MVGSADHVAEVVRVLQEPVMAGAEEAMTTREAMEQSISRLRRPVWANPTAYMKIDIIQQTAARFLGPWLHLYDRVCQEAIGEPTPQHTLRIGDTENDYEAYTGPLDAADEDAR